MRRPVIAIIGGGFCGTMTLIQLIRQSKNPLEIKLINKRYPLAKGIAFSSFDKNHLLNVAAGKMSAFPDQPNHFCDWIKTKPEYQDFVTDDLTATFFPRVVYGEYLQDLLQQTIQEAPSHVEVEIINDEVTDIEQQNNLAIVHTLQNNSIQADKVVLALGNFLPGQPEIRDKANLSSSIYHRDPWCKEAIENLDNNKDILIVGTSLTMVDNVISIMNQKNFKGKIYAVSTKGFFPLPHRKHNSYSDWMIDLLDEYSINQLYSVFKQHVRKARAGGITGEAVVDAIRPFTQRIWTFLSLSEKKRFMTHLRHLWGVARHRLPMHIYERIMGYAAEGRLEIIAGRFQDIIRDKQDVIVHIKHRGDGKPLELKVQRIINCTGPQTDIRKIDNTLIQNLINRNLIAPDPMILGMNAHPDGTIVHGDQTRSTILYTLGSSLKGILWESTAVPELRGQSKNLAGKLLKELEPVTTS